MTPKRSTKKHEYDIKPHVEPDVEDVCGYCGLLFAPKEIVIEREIHGRKWRFCSAHCLTEFQESIDFKDEEPDPDEKKILLDTDEDEE